MNCPWDGHPLSRVSHRGAPEGGREQAAQERTLGRRRFYLHLSARHPVSGTLATEDGEEAGGKTLPALAVEV